MVSGRGCNYLSWWLVAVSNERRQDMRQAEQLATIRLARAAAAMVWAGCGVQCTVLAAVIDLRLFRILWINDNELLQLLEILDNQKD